MKFKSFEPDIEVNGTTIMSIANALKGKFLVNSIFKKVGLPPTEKIIADAETFYSQKKWLDAFQLIAEKVGDNTLLNIGRKIPESAVFPPEIDNIEAALQAIDVAYHMNHRNARKEILFDPTRERGFKMLEGIGHYGFEKIANRNMAVMKCNNPYPCSFDRGIIDAMAQRFNVTANVMHDDSKPCRKNGANSCTYIIAWRDIK